MGHRYSMSSKDDSQIGGFFEMWKWLFSFKKKKKKSI